MMTEQTEPEKDILLLCYPDGSSETVELDPGTFDYMKQKAAEENLPFNEDYILKVIREGLELLKTQRK